MKIQKLTIENFRSITKAYEVAFDDFTILIGPNNEGKSNILYALSLTVNEIFEFLPSAFNRFDPRGELSFTRRTPPIDYKWARDFPIQLQPSPEDEKKEQQDEKGSIFILHFKLTNEEKSTFKQKTGYELKNSFGIKVMKNKAQRKSGIFPLDGDVVIQDLDNIKGFQKMADFLDQSWDFRCIPTIRTAELATNIVAQMIVRELSSLEENTRYRRLISGIEECQKKILQKLALKLTKDMGKYSSNVRKIKISTSNQVGRLVRQAAQIYVDDGVETAIDLKGDGVKSMLAISILHNSVHKENKNLCLAIEEPESHLHPLAIRRLREVIKEMAQNNQIIITTHSPLFVDRVNYKNNIIVRGTVARPAESVQEIRECLGVAIQDNLESASLILLVEGEDDAKMLQTIFLAEPSIAQALASGYLRLVPLDGVSALSYKIRMYDEAFCDVCVFLDCDSEALQAYQRAADQNLITLKSVFFARMPGYEQSEIEDLIDPHCYKDKIEKDFGVTFMLPLLRGNKAKWSGRMKSVFEKNSKLWDDDVRKNVKKVIVECVAVEGINAFSKRGRDCILRLKRFLIERLINSTHSRTVPGTSGTRKVSQK